MSQTLIPLLHLLQPTTLSPLRIDGIGNRSGDFS